MENMYDTKSDKIEDIKLEDLLILIDRKFKENSIWLFVVVECIITWAECGADMPFWIPVRKDWYEIIKNYILSFYHCNYKERIVKGMLTYKIKKNNN